MSKKLHPGESMPEMEIARLGGGSIKLGGKGRWQLAVVYRGKHCPICKTYLLALEGLKEEFARLNTEVVTFSADPQEKAAAHMEDLKLSVPVGYGLSLDQMRVLGLYISNPRDANETDRPFAEPGLFVVNPDGLLQAVDRASAPWLRPDLALVARGIGVVQTRLPQIRGTAA
ncbi:MAG: redoxin domain-containing protein [Betaproteobacteria bacterium]